MAQVWVSAEEAARGSLPAVCARSAQPCITRWARQVRELPDPVEWLAWTGLWPVGRRLGWDRGTIVLPELPRVHRRGRLLRVLRDLTAGIALTSFVAGLLVGDDGTVDGLLRWVTVGALGVHLLVALLGWGLTVGVAVDTTGEWVRLSRVHRRFVEAVEARTARPDPEPVVAPLLGARGTVGDVAAPPGGVEPSSDR